MHLHLLLGTPLRIGLILTPWAFLGHGKKTHSKSPPISEGKKKWIPVTAIKNYTSPNGIVIHDTALFIASKTKENLYSPK